MLTLTDGILLYHGSYMEISHIDIEKCKQGRDFGRGFYVTSSIDQARNFVPMAINKQVREGNLPASHHVGYVSVFQFHMSPDIRIHIFEKADKEWLHFVAANRRNTLFPKLQQSYDIYNIIGGKIANDRTARTLQLYTAGGYGDPGTEEADGIAIATLLPNRLENQFCFRSDEAISSLEYIRSEKYDV